jgi:glutathione S-transferase
MADEVTVEKLRALAASRRVSFAEVVREALEEKAATYRPKPVSLGAGESSSAATAATKGSKRQPPRSWR